MRYLFALFAAFVMSFATPALAQDEELPPEALQFLAELAPRSGTVAIPEAKATLDLGDAYIFYGPEDARRILTEAWGNPPGAAEGVLGMVMPAGTTPFSDAWGGVVTYEETGYVSDEDAASADYDELLEQMQEGAEADNAIRRESGYPTVSIVGWAEAPKYDASNHSVIWARELAFDDSEINSLNYDLRTLGRRGVLSINLVSTMPELENIRLAASDFASHASFDVGARYQDFDDSTDPRAGYGIAGLVAGGAGLAVAKKAGFLAVLLKFLKPILIGLAVLGGVLWKPIMRMFGRKEEEPEEWQDYEEALDDEPQPDSDEIPPVSEDATVTTEAGDDPGAHPRS